LERHGAGAVAGLGRLDAAVAKGAADVHDAGVAVDVSMLEGDPLARPQTRGGGEAHQRPVGRADRGRDGVDLGPGLEGTHLAAYGHRIDDAELGRVGVDQLPQHGPGEHLAQRLGGLEAVALGDRHPPRGDLARVEVCQPAALERGDGLAEQPAQLGRRLGLGLVLGEVLVDELGQRHRVRAATCEPAELALQRVARFALAGKAAALHARRVSSVQAEAVGPQGLSVDTDRLECKYLALVAHCTSSLANVVLDRRRGW
jgi:hypothetical protein